MSAITDPRRYQGDPDRVRQLIAEDQASALANTGVICHEALPGRWFVFQSYSADGRLTVGAAQGRPDPSTVWPVYEGLSEPVARAAAQGLADWYRTQHRDGDIPDHLLD